MSSRRHQESLAHSLAAFLERRPSHPKAIHLLAEITQVGHWSDKQEREVQELLGLQPREYKTAVASTPNEARTLEHDIAAVERALAACSSEAREAEVLRGFLKQLKKGRLFTEKQRKYFNDINSRLGLMPLLRVC